MNVDDIVAEKIAAARFRVEAAQQRRDDLAAARKRGLAHRHAAKLRHLATPRAGVANDEQQQDEASDRRASVRRTDGSAEDTPSSANTTEGAAP